MIVLIVGCERSGTSAISNLLSIGSRSTLLDDPPESWYYYPMVYFTGRKLPLSFMFKLYKNSIVKIPGFATILPQLKTQYWGSFKIVYVVRDPRNTISSIKERLDQHHNGLYTNVHWLGLKPKDEFESLVQRWKKYVELAIDYSKQNKKQVLFLRYEDFILDKIGTLNKIASFCGITFSESLVIDKLDKQYRKSWSSKIAEEDRYKRDLSELEISIIENQCNRLMKKFKYFVYG